MVYTAEEDKRGPFLDQVMEGKQSNRDLYD